MVLMFAARLGTPKPLRCNAVSFSCLAYSWLKKVLMFVYVFYTGGNALNSLSSHLYFAVCVINVMTVLMTCCSVIGVCMMN